MGLLDDAIREHLELKRQHGADPTEVERQEREAFGAAQRAAAERASAQAEHTGAVSADLFDGPQVPEADVPTPGPAAPPPERDAIPEPPVVETPDPRPDPAPLPDPGPPSEPDPAPIPDPPPAASSPGRDLDVDVDWTDTREPDDPPEDEVDEEEDVLEETPDFLQETPEHDRLWFEQRPPRDFDF